MCAPDSAAGENSFCSRISVFEIKCLKCVLCAVSAAEKMTFVCCVNL